MLKLAHIGVYVHGLYVLGVYVLGVSGPLVVIAPPALADGITPMAGAEPILPSRFTPSARASAAHDDGPMAGAEPILPSRFTPMGDAVAPAADASAGAVLEAPRAPSRAALPSPSLSPLPLPAARTEAPPPSSREASLPAATPLAEPPGESPTDAPYDTPTGWSLPLVDRVLTLSQKTADLAPDLIDAVTRIVPLYDPTRLEGPDAERVLQVSAGTAVMDNVFADHWRRADQDPNTNVKVAYLAFAWQMKPAPCDAFTKNRAHGYGEPALTALSAEDCARVSLAQARGFAASAPAAIAVAAVGLPVFAAPLPGSRLSSRDFWAAQRARVAAIKAHLAQRFHPVGAEASR